MGCPTGIIQRRKVRSFIIISQILPHIRIHSKPRGRYSSANSHSTSIMHPSVTHRIDAVGNCVLGGGYLQFQAQATRNTTDTPAQRTSTNKSVITDNWIEGKGGGQ